MSETVASVLGALVEVLLAELEVPGATGTAEGCRRFVLEFLGNAQPLHRGGVAVLALLLALDGRLTSGTAFARLPVPRRALIVGRWRRSRLGPLRDLVRLVSVLTITAYFDTAEATTRLGIERVTYLRTLSFYDGGDAA
jgi:hypothetical protein